jgi:hypothetical protein
MSSLTELFNPTFFMFLGITLLVAALLTAYFESKLREQNHKLTTMLSLVSSLAEELNGNKFAVNHLLNQMSVNGGPINVVPFQQNLEKTIVKKDMHELIEVSDDSDSDEEEEEESLSDEESETDNDSDNDSTTKTVIGLLDNNDNIINFGALSDIKIFKINNQDLQLQEDLQQEEENEFDDMPDLESVSSESSESLDLGLELGENINLDNVVEELSEVKEIEEQPLDLNEVKKINIMDLEEVKSIHAGEHNDYKKMSVQKLRSLVVERNLVADSSKMKKPELLKLLETEEKEEKEEKEEIEKVEKEN